MPKPNRRSHSIHAHERPVLVVDVRQRSHLRNGLAHHVLAEHILGENNVAAPCDHLCIFQSRALQAAAIMHEEHARAFAGDAVLPLSENFRVHAWEPLNKKLPGRGKGVDGCGNFPRMF